MHLFTPRLRGKRVNIQFTMIIDLFILYLRERQCKYSIHNDNGLIYLLPQRRGV